MYTIMTPANSAIKNYLLVRGDNREFTISYNFKHKFVFLKYYLDDYP